jgi:ribonuclease HI
MSHPFLNTIFCDAGFAINVEKKLNRPFVNGRIAWVARVDGKSTEKIEEVAIGRVPKLIQYNNILELIAVARAVEMANELVPKDEGVRSIQVLTDSKVAMWWARKQSFRDGVKTAAHAQAMEYLQRAIKNFGGIITYNHISRWGNPAGKMLDDLLTEQKDMRYTKSIPPTPYKAC